MTRPRCIALLAACALSFGGALHAEGVSSHVTKLDLAAKCLSIEWNNDTERKVCWSDKTKFSIFDTGKPAKPSDLRVGSWLRMEGRDEGQGDSVRYQATEIAIWLEVSRPAKP